MAATSNSGGDFDENFWLPFSESAEYLGMKYLGNIHTYSGEINEAEQQNFAAPVNSDS